MLTARSDPHHRDRPRRNRLGQHRHKARTYPDLTCHGLRHTGATWMADADFRLHVVREILSHASVETTPGTPNERYLASAAEHPGQSATHAAAQPRREACKR